MKSLARTLLRAGGWRIVGQVPEAKAYVLIAAPHTSNWDFLWTMATAVALGVRIRWFGKHTLFKPGVGWLLELWGGIPIRRHEPGDRVAKMAAVFRSKADLVLLVPAEGTRSYAPHWKSGFYHIARAAGVPIVLGFLDYGRSEVGFGPTIDPTGDIAVDMDRIREFYAPLEGRYPPQAGPVRLREEGDG